MAANKQIVYLFIYLLPLLTISCRQRQYHHTAIDQTASSVHSADTISRAVAELPTHKQLPVPAGFSEIAPADTSFILDLRYASDNNFVKTRLYDCPRCILKTEVADRLRKANELFRKKKLKLVLLDCYRPHSVQEKLWNAKPDPHFVMRPWKGSLHTRAIAVDVTLADQDGNYLDMGSEFDEFSKKSYYLSKEINDNARANRYLLRSIMRQAGFTGIRTEWWHFQYGLAANNQLQKYLWECD